MPEGYHGRLVKGNPRTERIGRIKARCRRSHPGPNPRPRLPGLPLSASGAPRSPATSTARCYSADEEPVNGTATADQGRQSAGRRRAAPWPHERGGSVGTLGRLAKKGLEVVANDRAEHALLRRPGLVGLAFPGRRAGRVRSDRAGE